jgi:hypothetical protein
MRLLRRGGGDICGVDGQLGSVESATFVVFIYVPRQVKQ